MKFWILVLTVEILGILLIGAGVFELVFTELHNPAIYIIPTGSLLVTSGGFLVVKWIFRRNIINRK